MLALGNFSARDEDIFLQLHAAEMGNTAEAEELPDAEDDEQLELVEQARELPLDGQGSARVRRKSRDMLGELRAPEPSARCGSGVRGGSPILCRLSISSCSEHC